ncbi:MAG: monovalent cation/H(+) antiporter subunit G [Gammaproteobacteria bacterium]|nr:monovalent cation/H(+) antiporter subunit G [Gammaproteobacteria bacterium]
MLLSVLVVVGAVFTFIGSLGLVRLQDFYTPARPRPKATTLGVGCLLVASSVFFSVTGEGLSLHELLVSLFLFICADFAHLLAGPRCTWTCPVPWRLPPDARASPESARDTPRR